MNKLFLSIIIPTLNEEKFLPKLLEDLKRQSFKNFEVIIVDGGSLDKTEAVASLFKKYLNIKFLKVDKKNVSYQRNFGAKKAKGQYLFFIDADSRIKSSFIKILFKIINNKKGLIFLPYLTPDNNKPQFKIIFDFINFLIDASQFTTRPFSAGGALIIENNFFNFLGGFDESLFIAEDHNLIKKAYLCGVRAKTLSNLKVEFSLRRLKKEGEFKVFYKYLLASAYYIFKGEIKNKIFDYPMGGHNFKNIKQKTFSFKDNFNDYLKQIKKLIKM